MKFKKILVDFHDFEANFMNFHVNVDEIWIMFCSKNPTSFSYFSFFFRRAWSSLIPWDKIKFKAQNIVSNINWEPYFDIGNTIVCFINVSSQLSQRFSSASSPGPQQLVPHQSPSGERFYYVSPHTYY
jgi:hypothetical protein